MKTHNSVLIVTFDENDAKDKYHGLTDPPVADYPQPTNATSVCTISAIGSSSS
jgi:hypothetical protein